MATLCILGRTGEYRAILSFWGAYPTKFSFLDTETIMSALRCRRLGVDVFLANACDPLGRLYDYSPLWLLGARLPVTPAWTMPVGLGFDLAFLMSLYLLPGARTWDDTALLSFAALSTPTAFALDRGNNDLVIFALAASVAILIGRSLWLRMAGYALATLAGLLKYYPLAVMAVAARERRLPVFLAVAASSAGALALFVLLQRQDLVRALALIPNGPYFGEMFGAVTLPGGIMDLVRATPTRALLLKWELALAAPVAGLSLWWGTRGSLHDDLATLSAPERDFLMVGALLVLGCFFSAQNIGYRAINLLFIVPAFLRLRRSARRPYLFTALAFGTLILLWSQTWRLWIVWLAPARAVEALLLLSWLLREGFWWWLVTTLAAMLAALLLASPVAQRFGGRAERPSESTLADRGEVV